jgi:glucose-6-phosphate isomerase
LPRKEPNVSQQLSIDYALAMADSIGSRGGLSTEAFDSEARSVAQGVSRVLARVQSRELGFYELPRDRSQLEACDRVVAKLAAGIDDILVLGIGGSSLGPRAAVHALSSPLANTHLSRGPRMHFPDNSDPWLFDALLKTLNPKKTLALVISKSGGTVETAAQLLCVKAWIEADMGPAGLARHLVAITDPAQGTLRAFATQQGLETLSIPSNVGGRFCVLTPAGLLPLRLLGLDASAMLKGAEAMAARCTSTELRKNPAATLAALHVLHTRLFDHRIHVMMPYADALRPFAAWFVQLWAESLGKRTDRQGRVIESGPTPLPAIGATDQHAQVQLFMEGPRDKLVTFIAVDEVRQDVTIPHSEGDLAYLGGHTLGELLTAERRGTALALARNGRPSLTIHLPRLDAEQLGALFFLFEAATAYAGELYDIDAFDQPGVEEGKRLAFGLLDRPGFEAHRQAVCDLEAKKSTRDRT